MEVKLLVKRNRCYYGIFRSTGIFKCTSESGRCPDQILCKCCILRIYMYIYIYMCMCVYAYVSNQSDFRIWHCHLLVVWHIICHLNISCFICDAWIIFTFFRNRFKWSREFECAHKVAVSVVFHWMDCSIRRSSFTLLEKQVMVVLCY